MTNIVMESLVSTIFKGKSQTQRNQKKIKKQPGAGGQGWIKREIDKILALKMNPKV